MTSRVRTSTRLCKRYIGIHMEFFWCVIVFASLLYIYLARRCTFGGSRCMKIGDGDGNRRSRCLGLVCLSCQNVSTGLNLNLDLSSISINSCDREKSMDFQGFNIARTKGEACDSMYAAQAGYRLLTYLCWTNRGVNSLLASLTRAVHTLKKLSVSVQVLHSFCDFPSEPRWLHYHTFNVLIGPDPNVGKGRQTAQVARSTDGSLGVHTRKAQLAPVCRWAVTG